MINKEMRQYPLIYSMPIGRYLIGWGAHTTVANECKNAKCKKVLIVTTGLRGTGIVDEIKGILEYNGVSTEIFDKVTSNPKDFQVMEGYKVFKEAECDGIVSIGGGSSHDCGKGIRAVATNNGKNISELYTAEMGPWMKVILEYDSITIPQIAINTTAGTGAETAPSAFITDTTRRVKRGCILRGIEPNIGITDPLLVRLMPERLAAWTGWDAFTHAMSPILSPIQVPHGLYMMLGAVKIFSENIREFTYNRMNHMACENMCYVESMGGYGIKFGGGPGGKFSTHTFSHPIGATTDAHHGLLNAAVTLPVERANESLVPDAYGQLARTMGIDTRGMTKMQAADSFFSEVERLLADLNITTGHLTEQVGLQQKDVDHIVQAILSDHFMVQLEPKERVGYSDRARQLIESML